MIKRFILFLSIVLCSVNAFATAECVGNSVLYTIPSQQGTAFDCRCGNGQVMNFNLELGERVFGGCTARFYDDKTPMRLTYVPVMWLDGNDPQGTSTLPMVNFISTWVDKSGNSNNATQSNPLLTPSWYMCGNSGLGSGVDITGNDVHGGCLSFIGTQRMTIPNILSGKTNYTIFAVVLPYSASAVNRTYLNIADSAGAGSSTSNYFGRNSTNYVTDKWSTTTITTGTPLTVDHTYLMTHTYQLSTNTRTLRRNGNSENSQSGGTKTSNLSASFPSSIGSRGASEYWSGAIMEIVVFDQFLSTAERDIMERYLIRKWGVL